MRFTDPCTCAFWYTHCQRCTEETPQLELAALEGECERCARRGLAMAEDCLKDPDGPVTDYPGYWWRADELYHHASAPDYHDKDR